jgi:chromosome segregation ATPase
LGGCEIDIKVIQGDLKKLQSLVNAHNSLVLDQGDKLKDLALARFGEIQVGKDSLIERKDILQASKVCEENSHIGVDAAGSCHYLEIVYKMHDEKIMELEKNLNVLKRSRYSVPAECWQDQETRMEKLESWRDDASLAKLSELILRQEGQISEVKRLREEADKAPTMKELLKPQEAQLLENGSQLSELDNKVSGHKDEISELKKQVKGLQNQLKQAEETFKVLPSASPCYRGRI